MTYSQLVAWYLETEKEFKETELVSPRARDLSDRIVFIRQSIAAMDARAAALTTAPRNQPEA